MPVNVTQRQFKPWREWRLESFRTRLRRHLVDVFPVQCAELRPEAIERHIDDAMARADRDGIRSERGLAQFIETAYRLHFGPATPELGAWAQRMPASTDLDPVAKMDHVDQIVRNPVPALRDPRD